jgi:hypothetical protein
VDETAWLECTDPRPLLEFLRGRASARKLRLFACACVRRVWERLVHAWSREAVETAEQVADGEVYPSGLIPTKIRGSVAVGSIQMSRSRRLAKQEVRAAAVDAARAAQWTAAASAVVAARRGVQTVRGSPAGLARLKEAQAALFREVLGNPFRPVTVDPAWLEWNDGAVRRLAQAAYDDRLLPAGTLDPSRLAVLADALEDAGCTDQAILDHLRGPGPHVRGCWAVDCLTGRQ